MITVGVDCSTVLELLPQMHGPRLNFSLDLKTTERIWSEDFRALEGVWRCKGSERWDDTDLLSNKPEANEETWSSLNDPVVTHTSLLDLHVEVQRELWNKVKESIHQRKWTYFTPFWHHGEKESDEKLEFPVEAEDRGKDLPYRNFSNTSLN